MKDGESRPALVRVGIDEMTDWCWSNVHVACDADADGIGDVWM